MLRKSKENYMKKLKKMLDRQFNNLYKVMYNNHKLLHRTQKRKHGRKKNEWFGKDEAMTYASFGIHKKLVEEEGFNPSSDEYYEEIDRRLRTEFPQKFNDGGEVQGSKQPVQTVASATRTTRTGRKTVRLTPSQVAIAKKLGVPLEEYAKYVKE